MGHTTRPLVALLDPATLEETGTFEAHGGPPTVLHHQGLLATRDGDEPGCLQRIVLDARPLVHRAGRRLDRRARRAVERVRL